MIQQFLTASFFGMIAIIKFVLKCIFTTIGLIITILIFLYDEVTKPDFNNR